MISNKFAGYCKTCSARVPVGAGVVERVAGKWTTFCRQHLPSNGQSRPAPVAAEPDELFATGSIRWNYSAQNLPLIRSLPGYRNVKLSDKWAMSCSVADADLPRVLELARKLGMVIAPELVAREQTLLTGARAKVSSVIPAELLSKLYPFQIEGAAFLMAGDSVQYTGAHYPNGGPEDAARSVPTNAQPAAAGQDQSGQGKNARGAGESGGEHEKNSSVRSVEEKGERGDQESHATSGGAAAAPLGSGEGVEGAWTRLSGGQRAGTNAHGQSVRGDTGTAGVRPGVPHQNQGPQHRTDPSVQLQGGLRPPQEEDRNRTGRPQPRIETTSHGRKENSGAGSAGLESPPHKAQITTSNRRLLADEMGLGKTVQVLAAAPPKAKMLVVAPNVVKYNWQAETARWRPDLTPVVLEQSRTPAEGEVCIINYDRLPVDLLPATEQAKVQLAEVKAALRKAGKKDDAALVKSLEDDLVEAQQEVERLSDKAVAAAEDADRDARLREQLKDVVLVVDECHQCKNYKAQRSQKITTLSRVCGKTWFLSGTPLLTRALDLWGVLQAGGMGGEVFGGWTRFLRLFNGRKGRWGGYEFGMPAPEVPELMRRVMLRRTKAEVLPELPAVTWTDLTVNNVPGPLAREMDALWEEWQDYLEDTDNELPPFTMFSKIRAKLAASRVDAAVEFAADCEEQGQPLVVFSAHRAPVDALADRDGWAVITGDTKPEDRTEIVRRFQAGELKGVALTIAAGGVGITLTHASTVLFVDLDWTPALNAQAADRVCRIGQKASAVNAYRMVSKHPLDQHVQKLICKKLALIQAAVENVIKAAPPAKVETPEEREARARREVQEQAEADNKLEESRRENISQRVEGMARRYTDRVGAFLAQPMTPERETAIRAAFALMVDNDPDCAELKNGVGFNKPDSMSARWLGHNLRTPAELTAMHGLLWKYRGQLVSRFPILWPVK